MILTNVVYTIKPSPKTQSHVWQIFGHINKILLSSITSIPNTNDASNCNNKLNLIDFKIPFSNYYGTENYINQLQLTFRTNNENEQHLLNNFLSNPLPNHETYKFELLKKNSITNDK